MFTELLKIYEKINKEKQLQTEKPYPTTEYVKGLEFAEKLVKEALIKTRDDGK